MKILFVCLGNICRSPTAQGVMLAQVAALPQAERETLGNLQVDSAGIGDYHVGSAPDARSQRAAAARGIDISRFRARQIRAEDFHRFDRVLAMDESNLAALEVLRPEGAKARLALLMDYARRTGMRAVPDPYTLGPRAFDDVLDLCALGIAGLLETLLADAHAKGSVSLLLKAF